MQSMYPVSLMCGRVGPHDLLYVRCTNVHTTTQDDEQSVARTQSYAVLQDLTTYTVQASRRSWTVPRN